MAISKELKIGIFVVAVIIATFIIINILRGADILGREISLQGRFDDVQTLVASAPVQIRGYAAGRVSSVEYDPLLDNFIVKISVDRRFSIPSDSRMMIFSTSIMGGKGIMIEYGHSDKAVADGDTLSTGSAADLIGSLSESIAPLLGKINGIADSLECLIGNVNSVLDTQNREAISSSLASLEQTLSRVRSFAGTIDGKSDEISSIVDNLKNLSENLTPAVESLNNTLKNASEISDGLKTADMEGTISSLKETLDKITRAVDDIKTPVTNFVADTDSLINAIKNNPKKYIKVSVF